MAKPPYAKPPNPPLTPIQRSRIIAYLTSGGGIWSKTAPQLRAMSDRDLLGVYGAQLTGSLTGAPPGILDRLGGAGQGIATDTINAGNTVVSVAEFLGKLADPHLWLRVGEVTIGVILIGVGINAAMKHTPAQAAAPVKAGFQRYSSNAGTSLGGLGSRSSSTHYTRGTESFGGTKVSNVVRESVTK